MLLNRYAARPQRKPQPSRPPSGAADLDEIAAKRAGVGQARQAPRGDGLDELARQRAGAGEAHRHTAHSVPDPNGGGAGRELDPNQRPGQPRTYQARPNGPIQAPAPTRAPPPDPDAGYEAPSAVRNQRDAAADHYDSGGTVGPGGIVRPPVSTRGADPRAAAELAKEQDAERDAALEELAAKRAQLLQAADARAGLAGMGLSGASSALQSDIGRQQDRSATLAIADLDRRHRDEARTEERAQDEDEWRDMQRKALVWDLEAAEGLDIDGDGTVGAPGAEKVDREERDRAANARDWRDTPAADLWGPAGVIMGMEPAGSEANPYALTPAEYREAAGDDDLDLEEVSPGQYRSRTTGEYFVVDQGARP